VWCIGVSNALREVTLLRLSRQSFSEGVDFIGDCLFCLRVVGRQNFNLGPFTGLTQREEIIAFGTSSRTNLTSRSLGGFTFTYIVHPRLFILGIGICVRVPPVDFVRCNKIILVWLGSGRYGWHPAMALALLLAVSSHRTDSRGWSSPAISNADDIIPAPLLLPLRLFLATGSS
jgi:hypothetical protein